jgi:hypothetical protein
MTYAGLDKENVELGTQDRADKIAQLTCAVIDAAREYCKARIEHDRAEYKLMQAGKALIAAG